MLIACDGSSRKNGDPKTAIGWAWAREDGAWMFNGMIGGSNNRAELHAILSILALHPRGELTVQMDSQYALNIVDKWAFGWEKKGWVKADKKPILNLDLVKEITALRHKRRDPIKFVWVKAHQKNSPPLNIRADELAGLAGKRAEAEGPDFPGMTYFDSKGRETVESEVILFDRLYGNRPLTAEKRLA